MNQKLYELPSAPSSLQNTTVRKRSGFLHKQFPKNLHILLCLHDIHTRDLQADSEKTMKSCMWRGVSSNRAQASLYMATKLENKARKITRTDMTLSFFAAAKWGSLKDRRFEPTNEQDIR